MSGLGGIGISIKGNQQKNDEAESTHTSDRGKKLEQVFTKEQLLNEWNAMVKEIASEKIHLAETLNTHQPDMEDGKSMITITVHNNIQEKRINEETDLIHSHLRRKLKNDSIRISVVVDETKEEKKFFTNSEKMQRMIQKNPDLNLLRKMFDLDLE